MNEAQWLASDRPGPMMRYLTHERHEAAGLAIGDHYRVVPFISQRKLELLDDVCFLRFGLTLDDLVVQTTPPAGSCDMIRDVVNPFRPVTLPKGKAECPDCKGRTTVTVDIGYEYSPATGGYSTEERECDRCGATGSVDGPCPWLTPDVLAVAAEAYERRGRKCGKCDGKGNAWNYRFGHKATCSACNAGTVDDGTLDPERLAVLSDALEEAGCPAEVACWCRTHGATWRMVNGKSVCCDSTGMTPHPLLAHLRSKDAHFRGCWAVDLILGKS